MDDDCSSFKFARSNIDSLENRFGTCTRADSVENRLYSDADSSDFKLARSKIDYSESQFGTRANIESIKNRMNREEMKNTDCELYNLSSVDDSLLRLYERRWRETEHLVLTQLSKIIWILEKKDLT